MRGKVAMEKSEKKMQEAKETGTEGKGKRKSVRYEESREVRVEPRGGREEDGGLQSIKEEVGKVKERK